VTLKADGGLLRGGEFIPAPGPKLHRPMPEPRAAVVFFLYEAGSGRSWLNGCPIFAALPTGCPYPQTRVLKDLPGGGPKVVP